MRAVGDNSLRVLIVEDDATTAAVLSGLARRMDFHALVAEDLAAAWDTLRREPVDIMLLDLSLPDGDGVDLLRRLRRCAPGELPDAKLPVLVISAKSQLRTRLAALDQGADGYVIKPVHLEEVAAVMRALLRRRTTLTGGRITYRHIVVDPVGRTVTRDGVNVDLSEPEFSVLMALLEDRPRPLTRADIQARAGHRVSDGNSVEVHVHHLRRKLGTTLIQTVRGVGYRLPPENPA